MTDELIQQLSKLIAEDIKSAPAAASVEQLVERLKRDERIERVIQVNADNALGFQTFVEEGGTANVGIHLHDFDVEKLQQVLKVFWKSLQPKESPNNLPRSGVAKFVGRDAELEKLHIQLQKGELVAISAIAGMGGVGKTELAIQYAKTFKAAYPAGVCWLLAREMNIGTQIVGYALVQLGLRVPDGIELPDQVSFCWRNWPEGNALIVLDDVTNYPNVEPYLPPDNPRFKVLLTTRLKFGPPVQTLPLGVLAPEKSLELLEVLIGKERVEAELEVTKSLCDWLGHLPLGLELVGRYLASMEDLSISEMLFRLQQKAQARKAIEDEALDTDQETWTLTAKRGVKAAFELSWDVLDEKSQHLGKLLSLFALAPIPWELAEQVKQKHCEMYPENGEFVTEEFRKARGNLLKFHLLQVAGQGAYQLHSLIREFFRNKLEGEVDVKG
ncbi:NB-ARC domain-containing protein [uncultured Nostoc sp.]|uniref:NB-ARC domain-containing protein n=1 Tax=uncultured Nostoc sp. TaxID=340711 RepID=UPI0035CB4412